MPAEGQTIQPGGAVESQRLGRAVGGLGRVPCRLYEPARARKVNGQNLGIDRHRLQGQGQGQVMAAQGVRRQRGDDRLPNAIVKRLDAAVLAHAVRPHPMPRAQRRQIREALLRRDRRRAQDRGLRQRLTAHGHVLEETTARRVELGEPALENAVERQRRAMLAHAELIDGMDQLRDEQGRPARLTDHGLDGGGVGACGRACSAPAPPASSSDNSPTSTFCARPFWSSVFRTGLVSACSLR